MGSCTKDIWKIIKAAAQHYINLIFDENIKKKSFLILLVIVSQMSSSWEAQHSLLQRYMERTKKIGHKV